MKIDLSEFPIRSETIYLNNCGVAPLYAPAAEAMTAFAQAHSRRGAAIFQDYGGMSAALRDLGAKLFHTTADNVAFTKNTAEGMSMLANGYPFAPGDEIISYIHEYPSNHFPWTMQEKRGVTVRLLSDRRTGLDPATATAFSEDPVELPGPCGWSMEELEQLVTKRTRVIAISHVQFTSGFAADLSELGNFCRERNIDLIVDAAQSLGCLPVHPERHNVAAVSTSGWKWLLGPLGTGLLYTSPELRERIAITMAGAEVVTQAPDYLDHRWQPHQTARMFEYSTPGATGLVGLSEALRRLWTNLDPDEVKAHAFVLQNALIEKLDPNFFRPLRFLPAHRSGILALVVPCDAVAFCQQAQEAGVFITSRGGYVRIAPHVYNTAADMEAAGTILNRVAAEMRQSA